MQDIFVSNLSERITNWVDAFPDSTLVTDHNSKAALNGSNQVFWLHVNEAESSRLNDLVDSITKCSQSAKIVVLANAPNQADCFSALSAGAVGYAHAYSPAEVLLEIKTVIGHGGLWLGQDLLQHLIKTSIKLTGNQPAQVERLLAQLTHREREVAVEVAKGLSNKEVARLLNITERTVKAHLAAVFERLGAKDRLQLALMLNTR